MEDIAPIIIEKLKDGGTVRFTPKGTSMLPLLRNGIDEVILSSAQFPIKKYEVVFYQRDNGQYVLHRFVKKQGDYYVMRGDNQFVSENNINAEQIIGQVDKFKRKGRWYTTKNVKYRIYSVLWVNTVNLRKIIKRTRKICGKVKRLVIGKINE
jgi:hypothetical protein